MNLRHRLLTLIFLLFSTPWTITWVNCQVQELTENDFQNLIDKHLIVFVLFYRPYDNLCVGQRQPGIGDFEVGARVAKENGMTAYLDLKFGKVNIQDQSALANKYQAGSMTCTSSPKIILFRYGRVIEYGKPGQSELSAHQLTTKGMFEFLEKRTQPAANIIKTEDELKKFVLGSEFTSTGYFQEDSKAKVAFWNVADRRKDYIWGAVTNQSLNEYTMDSIVVNQGFGATRVILNKNLTTENIEEFVEMNAPATGPILELTDKNFEDVMNNTLLVFVLFYDPACEIPEYFENGARIAAGNGMADYLDMKFGKLNIRKGSKTLNKYGVSMASGCHEQWRHMILFKYGKSIKYASSSIGVFWTQDTEKVKGLFEWLDKNTKPAAKIIQTEYQLVTFVEYTEVTVLGYLKKNSKARFAFWNTADKLKDYKWASVTNPYMNPYETDTIVITQEFGVSRLMVNEDLTAENIEKLVKLNANSTFPVPTRIVPTVRPDMNETLDTFHRDKNVVFVYDGIYFGGNIDKVDLTSGCIDITGNWEQEVQSIRTFGQCVKVYDSFGCKTEVVGGPLLLNDSNIPVQQDLGLVGFHTMMRSIESCYNKKSATSGVSTDFKLKVHTGIMTMTISAIPLVWMIRSAGV